MVIILKVFLKNKRGGKMKKILVLILGCLLIAVNLYAAGDLIVEGDAGIGTTTLTGKLNVMDATKVPLIIDNSTGTQNILEVKDNGVSMFTIADGGNIGIGTTPDTLRTINSSQSWNTSSTVYSGVLSAENSGTGSVYGIYAKGISTLSSGTKTWAFGGYYEGMQNGTGTVTNLEGIHAMTSGTGTGAVTNNTPLDVMGKLSAGTTTTARGVYIRNFGGTGTVTNVYGIYLEQQTKGANTYQIYSVGGKSYFGGDVGIGVTTPTAKLDVAGTVNASGGYTQVSDVKFKKDITAIESPLKKIAGIKGVSYSWNTAEYKERGFTEGRHYGVIGQEVEKVLPEIVKEGLNGEKSVSYTELIPVLIEAVKEQQKVIEGQQKEMKELKAEVRKLKDKDLIARSQ
jgi:hypothetical protein